MITTAFSLDDKLLLASMGQGCRRLDEKKIQQMNKILGTKIEEITSMHETISKLGVQFCKVSYISSDNNVEALQIKVNKSFTEAVVYWISRNRNYEVFTLISVERLFRKFNQF